MHNADNKMIFPEKITYRVHAIKRMFERSITTTDIQDTLNTATILNKYEKDKPYPSYLLLGWQENRPIHVVVAVNKQENESIIITAYEPTLEEWNKSFKKRKT